ncbi:hypothetical protein ACFZAU_02195 [Streptomyces sp. NPDC008238]
MDPELRELLGPPQRWRPAGAAAWAEIEEWVGGALPADFKEFVDEYGDCMILEFLGVAHPAGWTPLLECMKQDREHLAEVADQYRDAPADCPSARGQRSGGDTTTTTATCASSCRGKRGSGP